MSRKHIAGRYAIIAKITMRSVTIGSMLSLSLSPSLSPSLPLPLVSLSVFSRFSILPEDRVLLGCAEVSRGKMVVYSLGMA